MPRLIKYSTSGIIDDIPDNALAVIEHTALFYIIDRRFSGMNKCIAFANQRLMLPEQATSRRYSSEDHHPQ